MTDHSIVKSSATGESIGKIVHKLEDVLDGEQRHECIIACLSLVIIMQNPMITPEQLQKLVESTSEFICLNLEGTGPTAPSTVTLN